MEKANLIKLIQHLKDSVLVEIRQLESKVSFLAQFEQMLDGCDDITPFIPLMVEINELYQKVLRETEGN